MRTPQRDPQRSSWRISRTSIAAALALRRTRPHATRRHRPAATAALLGIARPTVGESTVTEDFTLTAERIGDPIVGIIDAGTTSLQR